MSDEELFFTIAAALIVGMTIVLMCFLDKLVSLGSNINSQISVHQE